MFVVISPAKKLDFDSPCSFATTAPQLLRHTRELAEVTRQLSATDLARLMRLSPALSHLNYQRFQELDVRRPRPSGSRPAVLSFAGDTYVGLCAKDFDAQQMAAAQEQIGILSGLYGLLRPLDAILPYRLEMGTQLATPRGRNLYEFWGDRVVEKIHAAMGKLKTDILINLASKEYFSVIDRPALKAAVTTPVFKELVRGVPQVVSFNAKRARGAMARYIIERSLTDPKGLKKFTTYGYRFVASESVGSHWLFLREAK